MNQLLQDGPRQGGPAGGLRRALTAWVIVLVQTLPAPAQSATSFDTGLTPEKAAATAPAAENAVKTAAPDAAPPAATAVDPGTSSRYAGADVAAYVAPRVAALAIHQRTTDPFGHQRDPDAKPIERKPVVAAATPAAAQSAAAPAVPFAEIIRQVAITAVMPSQKRFLVGTRTISEKDRFPITFLNKTIMVEVTEVTARQVTFLNLETGVTASNRLSILPPGMSRGKSPALPAGMEVPGQIAPLRIGANVPADPAPR